MDYTSFSLPGQFGIAIMSAMKPQSLTFITGNKSKAEQLARHLDFPVEHIKIDLPEIQSLDVAEVVIAKMRAAYEIIKNPVLVDDNILGITTLGRFPGTFIKFFEQELGHEKICRLTDPFGDRSATAVVTLGYTDGKEEKIFDGTFEGKISDHPKGANGFGWDVIFIPDGHDKTRAEMDEKEYDKTNPRRIAIEKLAQYLRRDFTQDQNE